MSSCAKSGMSLTHAVALPVTTEPPRASLPVSFSVIHSKPAALKFVMLICGHDAGNRRQRSGLVSRQVEEAMAKRSNAPFCK